MAEKRVIEYEAASELANDDWLLIDGVTEGTRKARPNVVTAELGAQVTNLASTVGGLTQVAMGHEQSFAPSYDESESYDVGDLVMQYHGLYRCTAATTGAWDAGKWARTEVSEQLAEAGKVDDIVSKGESLVVNRVADLSDMQDDIDSKVADVTIGGESIVNEDHVLEMDNFISKASIPSGAISTFGNAMALPMPSLTVGIEAVQSGTGDPSPTNIRPISGWSAVNVPRCGKNLYPHNGISIYDYAFSQQIAFSQMRNPIFMKGGQKYVLSLSENITLFRMRAFDKSQNMVTDVSIVNAHNQGSGTGLVFYANGNFFGYNGAGVNSITVFQPTEDIWFDMTVQTTSPSEVMFERGDTPSTYEAYSGTTYTTTLKDGQGNPLTCYGGELSNENGVQRLTNGCTIIDMGTINWVYSNGVFGSNQVTPALLTNGKLMCSQYKWNNTPNIAPSRLEDGEISASPYFNTGTVMVKDTRYSDATAFKTAMSGVMLVYELKNPQQIPQDNLAIATQDGTNNLWADSGDVLSGQYFTNSVPSNVYSTEEKAVGVDVDGKTRYQKTYLNLGNVTSYTFSDLTNVSTMFVVSEGSKLNGGLPFPYIHPDSDNVVGYFFDLSGTNPKIEIRKGSGSSSATLDMLTIQYTK